VFAGFEVIIQRHVFFAFLFNIFPYSENILTLIANKSLLVIPALLGKPPKNIQTSKSSKASSAFVAVLTPYKRSYPQSYNSKTNPLILFNA